MTDYYRRGDILIANLNPVQGSEQGGMRPVLCISNNTGNKHSHAIIVAAITTSKGKDLPTHIFLPEIEFLDADSMLLMEQIRTIDIDRVIKYLGSLPVGIMKLADQALLISIGINHRKRNGLVMTLCHSCASSFYDSPYHDIHRADPAQIEQESCTFCSRNSGFEYMIKPKKDLDKTVKL